MNLNDAHRASEELARAIGSGNAEAIARSAAANIWPLYNEHSKMLISAIVELPSHVLERHPMLRVLHPMTPVMARTSRAIVPTVYSDDARSMSPEEVDFLFLAQMIAFRLSGDIETALAFSRKLGDRIHQTGVESRDRTDGPLWYFHYQIGSTLLAAGDSSGALLEFATARQLGRISIQSDAERMPLGLAALAHAVRGAFGDAERSLAEARRLLPPTIAHESAIMSAESTAAALLAVDRMADGLDDVLAAMEPYGSLELSWPFALLARSRAFLARELPEDALEAIHLASKAHLTQRGSFAADVIAAMSIQAYLASGDLLWAQRVADENPKGGVLTRLAIARLLIQDGRFDAGAQAIRLLNADRSLGPAQRSELVLLSGWLEFGRNGEVARETALQISRAARRDDCRRQFSGMPRQLMEHVSERLPPAAAAEFNGLRVGLATFEMVARPILTSGELRVLNALPVYPSTAAMASAFHVSPNTVKSQLRTLYRKLGCSTRDEAIRSATRLRLLAGELTT